MFSCNNVVFSRGEWNETSEIEENNRREYIGPVRFSTIILGKNEFEWVLELQLRLQNRGRNEKFKHLAILLLTFCSLQIHSSQPNIT